MKKIYKKWDLHHHIVPEFYVTEMKKMGISVAGIQWPDWNPQKSLKIMDKFHIEKAFVSISAPGIYFRDTEFSIELSRKCNQYIADMIQEYPSRFGGFGSVTLPDVESAIKEAEYVLDDLKLDGIAMLSNVEGYYLGHGSFVPFYEVLNNRKAVIYVHPNEVPGKKDFMFLNPLYLWQNDTTTAILDFIQSGFHLKFPNIKWVFSHGGGIISTLFPAVVEHLKLSNPKIESELDTWKNQIFLDTASKAYDDQLPYLLSFSDWRHVVFGGDIGWANETAVNEVIKAYSSIDEKYGMTEEQIKDIFMDNAQRLFSNKSLPIEAPVLSKLKLPEFGKLNDKICYHCHDEVKAIEMIQSGTTEKVYLSIDQPELWTLDVEERKKIIFEFNNRLAQLSQRYENHINGFCAVDPFIPEWSVQEIERCINELKIEGVCLTIDMFKDDLYTFLSSSLIHKIGSIDKPVLIHPRYNKGLVLTGENRLESVFFIAKSFYLDIYRRNWLKTEFILSHTYGSMQYLSQPFNLLYYLSPKIKINRMLALIWETFILKRPKGYLLIKNMKIVD